MDEYMKHNYNMGDNKRYMSTPRERDHNYPSFSSTLLDQIYNSIDETNDALYRETAIKKKRHYINSNSLEAKEDASFQRIEDWIEKKKTSEKIVKVSEKYVGFNQGCQRRNGEKYGGFGNLNSSWSSSDSSSAGFFSSEADSSYGVSSRSSSTNYRPKPIKTSSDSKMIINSHDEKRDHEGGGVVKRSKLKALKIYGDLKKAKQPISPGAKLASFLNSIFATAKKDKNTRPNSLQESPACSTSRSCLSKTSSTRGNLSNTKRSVRFSPVSVIVDEDCQTHGHKPLQRGHEVQTLAHTDQRDCINEDIMYRVRGKNQCVKDAARELLKNYQRKVEYKMEEDNDEHDDDSCASSDLFELDSLNNNVIGKYMEELPVYETTYLDTNRAIAMANGL